LVHVLVSPFGTQAPAGCGLPSGSLAASLLE
jgi:hypothetical protein